MRFLTLMLLALTALIYAAGCGPVTMVDGQMYKALSDKEMDEMKAIAKHALATADRTIPASERELLAKQDPEVQIDYKGDKQGIYRAKWKTDKNVYELVIEGEFFSRKEVWILKVEEIQPEVLDFRNAPRKDTTDATPPTRLGVKDKIKVKQ